MYVCGRSWTKQLSMIKVSLWISEFFWDRIMDMSTLLLIDYINVVLISFLGTRSWLRDPHSFMAGNFWQSSHYQEWLLDKQEIELGRQRDLQFLQSPEDLQKVHIFFTNFIQSLGGELLKLRQQVISTAIVYYRRFYSRNSLSDIAPLLLCPTCIHLASKVEECGVVSPIQLVVKSRNITRQKYSGIFKTDFPYTSLQILECEFLLMEMLDCSLIVFHPYRPLTQYVADLGQQESLLPTAWRIVNDTYRWALTGSCFSSSIVCHGWVYTRWWIGKYTWRTIVRVVSTVEFVGHCYIEFWG